MSPKILKVKAEKLYVVSLVFDDGVSGIVSFDHLAGKGVFRSWDEDKMFFQAYVDKDSGALTWPNGIDMDTVNIYCRLKNITPEQYFAQVSSHA